MGNRKYDKREKSVAKKVGQKGKQSSSEDSQKIQETIEGLRIENEHFIKDYRNENEKEAAEFSVPKILVTTSRRPSPSSVKFARALEDVFPTAQYCDRGSLDDFKSLIKDASAQEFTHMIVVDDDAKAPIGVTVASLPSGPCIMFKLSSVKLPKEIRNYGKSSSHCPELILNNFSTGVGKLVGKFLGSLFPRPDFKGRQVVTFHNQRDFIFFRRHRYIFDEKEKRNVRTQEIGPQFTLKLKRIMKSLVDEDICIFDQNDLKKKKKETSSDSSRSTNNKVFIN